MKNTINIILDIEKLEEGYYVATSRDVPGLVAEAKTFEKTVEIAEDLAKILIQAQNKKVTRRTIITYPIMITA
jgi:predicted RNase H-like HicB family nuclease